MTAVEWLKNELTVVERNLEKKTFLQLNNSLAGHRLKDLFEQAKEMENQQQGYSEEKVKPLLSFIREIKENWDCDEDSHKYNTICRCCDAEKTLIEFKNKSL
jgi:hypothetical protein